MNIRKSFFHDGNARLHSFFCSTEGLREYVYNNVLWLADVTFSIGVAVFFFFF